MDNICVRCHEPILDDQETEEVPFIPRWGWTSIVHKDCDPVLPTFEVVTG